LDQDINRLRVLVYTEINLRLLAPRS
jgi:hypothetical protein